MGHIAVPTHSIFVKINILVIRMAKFKTVTIPCVDKDVEPLELSHIAGGVQIDTLQKMDSIYRS